MSLLDFRRLVMVVLIAATPFSADGETKVLFIGNSFTIGGTASVPTIFDRLAQAGGKGDPTTVMRAVSGMDFQFHATDPETLATIRSQPWDFVVLQNFSTEPTHFEDTAHCLSDHFTYGAALFDAVIANRPDTQVLLFETWSRATAHPSISGVSGPTSFASTAEMQGELRRNYRALADSLNSNHPGSRPVQVAPIGDAWENAGGLRSASDPLFVDLHANDAYHGDDDGYYLSAAVLYAEIFGESPVGLSESPQVQSLNLIRDVAAERLESVAFNAVKPVPEPGAAIGALAGLGVLAGVKRLRA